TTFSNLLNETHQSSKIPHQWKKSVIVLLPKKINWTYDLSDTRPISLLEASRKIYTKHINSILSHTILKNKILSSSNFAGLRGQSVFEPLSIVSSELNYAKLTNSELWIASFDISKAYDSVNISCLEIALKRIKIPNKLINLILSLLKNRKLQISTNYSLTKEIEVSNGLDQEETLSPLLWTIFYDPMITKINKLNNNKLIKNILAY